MPLTDKGEKIKSAMTKEYGGKRGEEVFYASKNKGTISGVDEMTEDERKKEAEDAKKAQAHDSAPLIQALRKKFKTPQALLKKLGLDESLLSKLQTKAPLDGAFILSRLEKLKPKIAQDADLKDLLDLIDLIKGAGAGAAELPAMNEGNDGMEPNSGLPMGLPGGGEKKEEPKAADQGLAGEMEKGSWDADPAMGGAPPAPAPAPEAGGGMAKVVALLKMALQALTGGGDTPNPAMAAADGENCASGEPKAKDEGPPFGESNEPEKEKKAEKKENPAMDQKAMDAAIKVATSSVEKRWRDIRDAERAVRPYVGELAIAFDSGEAVYRHALKAMGVEGADKVHASALSLILGMQPTPGSRKEQPRMNGALAMDAANADSFNEMFPDAARIKSF